MEDERKKRMNLQGNSGRPIEEDIFRNSSIGVKKVMIRKIERKKVEMFFGKILCQRQRRV